MKLVIDVSNYQKLLSAKQWDLLATIVDGVIIRIVYGTTFDEYATQAIKECESRGIQWTAYGWVDPTKNMISQQIKFRQAIDIYNPPSLFNDYEQYWSDWAAYMRQDLVEAKRTRFTPDQLNKYYKTFHDWCSTNIPASTGNYTGLWFIDEFCPNMKDWVWESNSWEARYLRYYDAVWFKAMKLLWGNPYNISKVEILANYAKIINGGIRQFETLLTIDGLKENIEYHLDWNVSNDTTYYKMFGVNTMGINITFDPFISQLGEGAGMHNNDCGPADCSNVIHKAKDIFISPDELYKLPGWGAPTTDVGTNATQLQLILSDFEVKSTIGYTLTIDNIKGFIDKGWPIITLVKYGLFSAAGLTINKGTFNHWFIVTGYSDTEIITLDPYRPCEAGGIMKVPTKMFTDSYLGSYLLCELGANVEVPVSNATVNNPLGVNIRKTMPISSTVLGTDIGDLVHLQKVTLKEPIVDHPGLDGLIWIELVSPMAGWVAKKYFIIDAPVTPPPPPVTSEKAIRLDELSKLETYIINRKNEINNS